MGSFEEEVPEADWPASERGLIANISEVDGPDLDEDGEPTEMDLHCFDGTAAAGDAAIIGFRADWGTGKGKPEFPLDKSGNPEIWFSVNTDHTTVRLNLTYSEHLETLLLTRGMFGWQYLFADPCDPGLNDYFEQDLSQHLDIMARVFPDDDFSALQARNAAFVRARKEHLESGGAL